MKTSKSILPDDFVPKKVEYNKTGTKIEFELNVKTEKHTVSTCCEGKIGARVVCPPSSESKQIKYGTMEYFCITCGKRCNTKTIDVKEDDK